MELNSAIEILSNFGISTLVIVAGGYAFFKFVTRLLDGSESRENELLGANRELLSSNKELLETNRILVYKLEDKLSNIDSNVTTILGKLDKVDEEHQK